MTADDYFHRGWKEYLRHLPEDVSHPMEILALRGHILIERQITQLIEIELRNPSALDIDRMRYGSKVRLAHALLGDEVRVWIWEALSKVNVLRNSIAHKLADDKIEDHARALIDMVRQDDSLTFQMVAGESIEDQLNYSLGWVHERLLNECINRGAPVR
jgi:hypothetical protein